VLVVATWLHMINTGSVMYKGFWYSSENFEIVTQTSVLFKLFIVYIPGLLLGAVEFP
jgi:hypothetical protein